MGQEGGSVWRYVARSAGGSVTARNGSDGTGCSSRSSTCGIGHFLHGGTMKRPKLRKASKRMSCSKRYKIQKKVREHNRKVKKEAKKNGGVRRARKEPGVPSSAPFKEEVLREAEQRRRQIEEQQEKLRQAKREERAKKRKAEKEDGTKEPKPKKARQVQAAEKPSAEKPDRSSPQVLCAELMKVVHASDVVLEVLDARDPLGCRCPELEQLLLSLDKKLVLVLSRIDLVSRQHLQSWMRHLQQEAPVVAFKAPTSPEQNGPRKRKPAVPSADVLGSSKASACFGGSCLSALLSDYAAGAKDGGVLKVGVVGFPNVGKSSVINGVKGAAVCNVGVQGGTTRRMQEVAVAKDLKLLDSPALVAAPGNPPAALALRSLQGERGLLEAVRVLLKSCDTSQVLLHYTVPSFRNSVEFLTLLAQKRGLQKKGVPDTEQAAAAFLGDWTGSRKSYCCKGPDKVAPAAYMSDAAVARLMEGWDLEKLQAGNQATVQALRFPHQSSGITFTSPGPTSGLLSVDGDAPPPSAESAPPISQVGSAQEPEDTEEPQGAPAPLQSAHRAASTDDYDFNTDFK